jgi:signal transduction histidine kinase
MELLRASYYFFVFAFTAGYCLAFIFFLPGRFQYSRTSRSFAIFLGYVFLWAFKDALTAAFFPFLDTRTLRQIAVLIMPLFLFIPLFSFHMLISVYNASIAAEKRFRDSRIVYYAIGGICVLLYLVSLIDHSFVYLHFAKGHFDYYYDPGIFFAIFLTLLIFSVMVPAIGLLRISFSGKHSEAFVIGLGSLISLGIIVPTNMMPAILGLTEFPRFGCLSICLLCALAFYGIRRHGVLFSIDRVLAERDLFETIGLSILNLVNLNNEDEMYQGICDQSRELSQSSFVCVLTYSSHGSKYEPRAVSRALPGEDQFTRLLPLTLHKTFHASTGSLVRRQASNRDPLHVKTVREVFGTSDAAEDSLSVNQIISYPIVYENSIKGAILFFKARPVSDINSFGLFSLQGTLVMKFSSQIRELEEKRILAEQLRQSQKMEAIGLLAGGIAHDFNNLLAGISGFAQLLKRKFSKENTEVLKYVEPIIDASARGAALTRQLLAFARKGKYQLVSVDVHEVLDRIIGLLRRTIDRRIQISKDTHATAPAVMGDPSQIENALLNLALNARDAMPEGGNLVFHTENLQAEGQTVVTGAETYRMEPGAYLVIEVVDSGLGMNAETKKRLFEPFFTTKEVGKGTGLGLASVYGCAKSHNGYIEIESAEGVGTTARLYFPASQQEPVKPKKEPKTKAISRGKGHILVIDDEEIVRSILREMLHDLGYHVSICSNGSDGIEYYRQHINEIDLVVVDMIMPKMGGYDCLRHLRKIKPEVKVVISTGYSVAEDTQQMFSSGIAGFIQKPFEAADLSRIIADALN